MKDYSQAFINTNGEEFPNTKAVDAGSPGNTNGTEIIADLLNDNWGFSQALLKAASIIPNGEDETADNSQKLEAIKKLYNDADTALKNILTQTITQENTALQNNINTEKTQRTQADTTLQNNINTEKARITKEITDRTNADKNLQNQINTVKYNIPSNGTEVKMPYTIDGKAVYKRFWSKSFTNNQIIYEYGKTTSELSDRISKDLKRRGMRFVGSTIIYSYLQAIGVINSHEYGCFLYQKH